MFDYHGSYTDYIYGYPLAMTNNAIENGPFIEDLLIYLSKCWFSIAMLVYRRVCIINVCKMS